MTHWTDANDLIEERGLPTPGFAARFLPGALAFTLSAALGVYLVYLRAPVSVPAAPPELAAATPQDAFGGLDPLVPAPSADLAPRAEANPYGALVTKGFGTSARFAIAESSIPTPPVPPSDLRLPQDEAGVPLPPRRPSALARQDDESQPAVVARLEQPRSSAPAAVPAAPSAPGILEKLFGGVTTAPKAPESRLAYAPPPPVSGVGSAAVGRGGLSGPSGFGGFLSNLNIGSSNPTSRYGDRVAVYDISAHVVYMPDGTRIEAHSGLGEARDDPNKVNERMRGPTPPATYALTPREGSFHGVDALRLTPIDGNVFGRAGLLAHTYMLGAEGDSNGCISFRDYNAFLRAYRNGQVSKVVVVTRL